MPFFYFSINNTLNTYGVFVGKDRQEKHEK